MTVIMFLWKPFRHFLMTVLFYLHVKNILNLNSFDCFLFINHWFSYIFSGLSKSSHISLCYMACKSGCILFIKSTYNKTTKHQKASHYSHISLQFLLYFTTIHLYKFHSVLNCIMTSYLQMLSKQVKIAKITLFLGLFISSLLFCCGDIEKENRS